MASSDFAQRQLEKHGWKKGSGLGKQEDGMSNPLKVTLKMDKSGVGHDPGKEFTDHWWLRVFNDAAKKINSKDQGKKRKSKEETNKQMDKKQSFYAGFVKSCTLTNGVEEKVEKSDSSSDDDSDSEAQSVPTLNDIHKFCGGATGHKAARFGIKMGGKLARIAEHDRMFEEKRQSMSQKADSSDDGSNSVKSSTEISATVDAGAQKCDEDNEVSGEQEVLRKAKKKKKKKSRIDIADDLSESYVTEKTESGKKKKKKSRTVDLEHPEDFVKEVSESNSSTKKKKKSKTKTSDVDNNDIIANENESKEGHSENKKTKKSKKQLYDEGTVGKSLTTNTVENDQDMCESSSAEPEGVKRKKKKKRPAVDDDACFDISMENEVNKKRKKNDEHLEEPGREQEDSVDDKKTKRKKKKKDL